MAHEHNPEISPYTIVPGAVFSVNTNTIQFDTPVYTFEGSTSGMSIPVQSPPPLSPIPPPPPIIPSTIFMSGDVVECIGVSDENNGPHKHDYGGCGAGWTLGRKFTIKTVDSKMAWPVEEPISGVYIDHIKVVNKRPKNMIIVPGIGGEATNKTLLYVSNKLYSFLHNKSTYDGNSGQIYLLGKPRNQKHNTAIDCIRVKYDGGCGDSNKANPESILVAVELLSEFDIKPIALCTIRGYLDQGVVNKNIERICREYNDLAMVLFTSGIQIVWKGEYRSLLGIRKSI